MSIDDKTLDIYFIHFKRFLKENGCYTLIINYLFPGGRTKKDFFNEVRKLYSNNLSIYDFGDILHIVYVLGPSYIKKGHTYWQDNIAPISSKWAIAFSRLKL